MNSLYDYNVSILKRYNDNTYKLTTHNCLRSKGYSYDKKNKNHREYEFKMQESIRRSKSKVLEYALCNNFQYFVTFTLDKEKYNRYDLSTYKKDLSKMINNYNNRNKCGDLVLSLIHI